MFLHAEFYHSIMSRCINFSFRSKPQELTINSLPDELLLHIFQFLPPDQVLECEKVCRRWRKLAQDTGLWRRLKIVCSGQLGEVCPKTVKIIKSQCTMVYQLKMQYILNYPILSQLMCLCDNLLSLEILMCRIEVEFEEDLKKWPNLKRLNLKNSLLKSERKIMLQFDHFKSLTYLGLSDWGLTEENCDSLLQCNHLNHIVIDKIRGLKLEYIKKLIATKQQTLQTLHIYGGDSVDDECLMMLSQCPMLRDLAITRCENLTDRALDGLSKLSLVTHLQLWNNNNFSEDRLKTTLGHPNLTKLRRLSLSRIVNVTRAIVDIISQYYKNLKFLAVYQCPKIINTDYERQLKSKFSNIEVVLY